MTSPRPPCWRRNAWNIFPSSPASGERRPLSSPLGMRRGDRLPPVFAGGQKQSRRKTESGSSGCGSTGPGLMCDINSDSQPMPRPSNGYRDRWQNPWRHASRGDSAPEGMTLIELLVGLALLGMVLLLVANVFITNIHLVRAGTERVLLDEEARRILGRLTADIQSISLPGNGGIPLQGEDRVSAGDEAPGDMDTIRFSTILSSHQAPAFGKRGRLAYVLTRAPNERVGTLWRILLLSSPDGEQVERRLLLSERVRALNFRYFSHQRWYRAWQEATLPQGVEITLVLQGKSRFAGSKSYRTFVRIPLR
ncbi:MAG: prepilin-type N-terminal cleavage/methylation domain-containing protein [Nitrospinota bacterium]|nr:MAG: prepilin-type N-terminal cleavage/methylation domain-containing protein [Nitrospinota bacterium]